MATTSPDRIASLDIIRGIAVMGILSVNIVGMSMIEDAYFYPPIYGFGGLGDKIMWAANFILVDGKLRSLFSILFGASTILVIERGIAAGKKSWEVHYPRMIVLLAFGLIHFYFLWWGDILSNYALVGMIAFIFYRLSSKWLLVAAFVSLALFYGPNMYGGFQQVAKADALSAPDASAADHAKLEEMLSGLYPEKDAIAEDKEAHTTLPAHFEATLEEQPLRPFMSVPGYGLETLGLMLIGMAGYKSGFLTGAWSRRRYWLVAGTLVTASLALFSVGTFFILRADFYPITYFPWDRMYVMPMHAFSAIGYAALIILVVNPRSAIGQRLAAVGRAAFTNYLGSTIVGILIFYSFAGGLYGDLSRGQVWLFVPVIWALMLLWSKPWLERYRYGPMEWAWRSLSRWRWEPMRRRPEGTEIPAAA